MSKTCESCRYVVEMESGFVCRRYPPILTVKSGMWCGEWKSNKPTVTKKTQERGKRLDEYVESCEDYDGLELNEWMPSEFMEFATSNAGGFYRDQDHIWNEWEKFIEYFINNKDCKEPVKKDWLAAWRNWIRRSKK